MGATTGEQQQWQCCSTAVTTTGTSTAAGQHVIHRHHYPEPVWASGSGKSTEEVICLLANLTVSDQLGSENRTEN